MQTNRPAPGRPWLPLLWLPALVWLSLQTVGNGMLAILDSYDRMAGAAGRAAARAGRQLLRALGPVGRLIRRLTAPLLRLLRRVFDLINVRLLLRMFRPMGRWASWCWARTRPVVDAVSRWGLQLVARLEPLLVRLATVADAVEHRAGRLAAVWRRVWAPVRSALPWRRAPR